MAFQRGIRVLAAGLIAMAAGAAVAAEDGKALYQQNCSKCHGEDGLAHTTRGYLYFARNFTSAGWQANHSDDDIYDTISNGPGWWSVMPAFKETLSEADRRALVRVVRGFAPTAGSR